LGLFEIEERFDRNGTQPDLDEVLKDRTAVGFYIFLKEYFNLIVIIEVALSFEYQYSHFERELDSETADAEDRVQLQLTLQF
jgi:hypothetical protein